MFINIFSPIFAVPLPSGRLVPKTSIVISSLETILGSIRILKWNYTDVLPIQKIFGINPLLVTNEPNINAIYHIGRFAIRKDISDLNLFKKLLFYVAQLICKHPNNIAFAECDSKLLRILNLLGVKTSVIGASVNYLGSETIPIQIDYEGSIDFYNKNKHLMANDKQVSQEPLLVA